MSEIFGALESKQLYQQYLKEREGQPSLSYVLLSGGPDSATVLYELYKGNVINSKDEEVRGLFVNFGQPYAAQELEAAQEVAESIGVPLEILEIACLSNAFKNKGEFGYPIFRELLPAVIGSAALHAIFNGSNTLYHGNILEDEQDIPGTVAFFKQMQEAINKLPGGENFQIKLPFATTPKYEVFEHGIELDVPFGDTVSCLQPGGHCGKCRACLRRAQAFNKADIDDPTQYQAPIIK